MNGKNSTCFVMVLHSCKTLQYVSQIIFFPLLLLLTFHAQATKIAAVAYRAHEKPMDIRIKTSMEEKVFSVNASNNVLSNQIPLGNGKYQITFIFQSFPKNKYSSQVAVMAEDEMLIEDLRNHLPSQDSKSFAITREVSVQDGTLDIVYKTANVTLSLLIKKTGSTTAAPPSLITLLPPDQGEYVAGSAITLTAKIKAGSPTIQKVKFYANNNYIGETKPSTDNKQALYTWENVAAGTYQIKAEAHLVSGTKQVSKSATWLVKEAQSSTPSNGKVKGLEYKYYEGNWTKIPPYAQMTPKKKGVVDNITLNPKMRGDKFGFAFTGYIKIEQGGTYTFYLASDDGSQFFINDIRLFNNDGTHGLREVSKPMYLKKGYHPIKLYYFENTGAEKLIFSYAGPGFGKKSIPSSVLFRDKKGSDDGGNAPSPPEEPTEPEEPSAGAGKPGLRYVQYLGSYKKVSEMTKETAVEEGVVDNFTLAPKKRESYFGFDFTGYIKIEKSGSYTFYTTSDEGSKLWIGSKEVVNNDGPHTKQERSGTITLQAGLHPIKVSFFERSQDDILEVRYAGPGFGKKSIPSSVLFRDKKGSDDGGNAPSPPEEPTEPEEPSAGAGKPGLRYVQYLGSYKKVSEMTKETAVEEGVVDNFTLAPKKRESYFGFDFTGYIKIEKSGSYTFYTTSDEGSKLWIGSKEVVNNDGPHTKQERSGTITLQAGLHPIKVSFFERSQDDILEVRYAGPGFGKKSIPSSVLFRDKTNGSTARVMGEDEKGQASADTFLPGEGISDAISLKDGFSLYPNPASDIVYIRSIEGGQYFLYDAQGQLLQTGTIHPEANPYQMNVGGLPRGMYYVRFESMGQTWMKKLIVQ